MLSDAVPSGKCCPSADLQSDPSGGQDRPELAARKERDNAFQRVKTGDEAIGAGGNLRGRFTMWAAIPKYIPVRPSLANIRGALSFVVAIVPLGQVRFNLACGPQSS